MQGLEARASDASSLFRPDHIWAPGKHTNCCQSGGYLISEGNGTAFAVPVSDESAETAQKLYLSRDRAPHEQESSQAMP